MHENAGDLCIALGEPRFADASLSAIASTDGPAAAWLAAYRSSGPAATARVAGRFCAIVLRPEQDAALLVTDRFATWPVCYSATAERLAFADSAAAVPGASRELSLQALFDYLYFHAIPAPATVFAHVERLPAGHTLEWRAGTKTLARYWTPHFVENIRPDLEQSKQRFRRLIRDSVAREAGSRNAAAFLSGGTDSSTVVGTLREVSGRAPQTYSIGFEAQGYDEMEYARIAVRKFGARHHEYYVTPGDLIRGMPQVAAHYDQPFGNSSALPAWICAARAKADGVEVMLAGDGGDELFGGNVRYAVQRVFGFYDALPRFVRNSAFESAVLALRGVPVLKKAASYVAQARVPMPDRLQTYNLLTRVGIGEMLAADFLASVDTGEPSRSQKAVWDGIDAGTLTNRMLAFDWQYTLADNDLPKVTGTAALAGVDVAFPLLDDDLVDFSLSLPPSWKVRGLTLRWFFKEALRDFLPIEIIEKRKHGFGLPFGVWTNRDEGLQKLARDALGSFETRGIVQPKFTRRLLEEYLPAHPGYYGELIWIFTMLELWLRNYAPDWRAQG